MGPDERDVRQLTELLDLLDGFTSNEQRARYLLTCNWFTREGVAVATRAAIADATFWAARAPHVLVNAESPAQPEG